MKVTLVLPAYNEERDLPELLNRVKAALEPWTDYLVLVVDDGSIDRTADIIRTAQRQMPITLIQHPKNQGLGAAMRTGLKAAASLDGTVVTMDADNSQGPELIRDMIAQIDAGSDVVIASRFQVGSKEIGVPRYRLFLSHASSSIIRSVVRFSGARDYTCGFRAYRLDVLRELINKYGDNFLRENGFSCMFELLLNCRRIGATVTEVPLILRYDLKLGDSKMRVWRTAWRYLITIVRGYLPLSKQDEPIDARTLREAALAEHSAATKDHESHDAEDLARAAFPSQRHG